MKLKDVSEKIGEDPNNDFVHGYTGVLVMDCLIAFIILPLTIFLALKMKNMNFVKGELVLISVLILLRVILEIVALSATKFKRVYLDDVIEKTSTSNETEFMIHYRDAKHYAYFSLFILNLLLIGQSIFTYKQVKDEEGTTA